RNHGRARESFIRSRDVVPAAIEDASPAIEQEIRVEVVRGANQEQHGREVAEKAQKQADAIGAKQIRFRLEEAEDDSAAQDADDGRQVTELHIAFAIAVDVVDEPPDQGAKP